MTTVLMIVSSLHFPHLFSGARIQRDHIGIGSAPVNVVAIDRNTTVLAVGL